MSICAVFVLLSCSALAQDKSREPEAGGSVATAVEQLVVNLPDSSAMAAALARPASRRDAWLTLAAAAHALQQAQNRAETDQAALARVFLDDRGWLQSLVERFGWRPPHAGILDPAAWLVLEELGQHALENTALTFPGAIPGDVLLHQVFHRANPRHAAAVLPVLLQSLEADAVVLWDRFLQLASPEGQVHGAWRKVEDAWFARESAAMAEHPQDEGDTRPQVVRDLSVVMSKMVRESLTAGPPDDELAARLRFTLLRKVADASGADVASVARQAADSLYVVSMAEGLHDGHYFDFVQGLLALVSGWLEEAGTGAADNPLADWMYAELPAISSHYAQAFARVDPGLNDAVARSYRVLNDIVASRESAGAQPMLNVEASRTILADAIAVLALQIPDMVYYFDTPVRSEIIEQINGCISMAVSRDEEGEPAMNRAQFDGCLEGMLLLADSEIRTAELSGNTEGPFTEDALRRELGIPPWQRINYGAGYLQTRYSDGCKRAVTAFPNPLEWSVLANTMAWLAEQAPGNFHTEENEARIARMRSIGEQLVQGLAEQSACLAASANGDMISRVTRDYEQALRVLDQGIESAEQDFRARRLRPGADVTLAEDALQRTAYRPDDLLIGPCESGTFCDMTGELSVTRALIGLFPDEYLVADQTGMGRIEVCYRNMEWVQRRSELVRPDDENVANYYGRLGFDLLGRYVEGEQATDIFGFRFTSPEEYHYLFAQASEEILQDSCPVEWVGSRVVTPLRESRAGIVPNRLTYLAAARNQPSRLLQNNWDQGAEWRDWFVTGLGVTPLEMPAPGDITTRLDQHLQSLYQLEQAEVYQRVLLPNVRNDAGDDVSLFDEMSQVSINKAVMRMLMMLFYPAALLDSDEVRTGINGDSGLLDGRILRRFREEGVALTTANRMARERLQGFRSAWERQLGEVRAQGSIDPSVAYALTRINMVYRSLVTTPRGPLQETEPSPEA